MVEAKGRATSLRFYATAKLGSVYVFQRVVFVCCGATIAMNVIKRVHRVTSHRTIRQSAHS
jgi:hypothetical protein